MSRYVRTSAALPPKDQARLCAAIQKFGPAHAAKMIGEREPIVVKASRGEVLTESKLAGVLRGLSRLSLRVARPSKRCALSVEERFVAIVSMMRRGKWTRGDSAQRLAAEWDVPLVIVEQAAVQASMAVRALGP